VKILLTGASSFTGYWFARELSQAGHHVVAPLPRAKRDYSGLRAARVARLADVAEIVWSAPFGEPAFMAALSRFDLLCHHAARMTDYRSPEFDIAAAFAENTRNVREVLRILSAGGLRGMVLTGTVFEADEGAGEPPLRAFSPYGVSKTITAACVQYWCAVFGTPLGKFVIPNPFGPFEEPRFCTYLVKTWRAGQAAEVKTPRYVRDNIHVDLLAKGYGKFCESFGEARAGFTRMNPSGYVETQGAFAERFARELGPRLGLEARVVLKEQTDFAEPMMRVNTEPLAAMAGWREPDAWDRLADYYKTVE
jgi:nucleoside-diphosphate-sugar epimerase